MTYVAFSGRSDVNPFPNVSYEAFSANLVEPEGLASCEKLKAVYNAYGIKRKETVNQPFTVEVRPAQPSPTSFE